LYFKFIKKKKKNVKIFLYKNKIAFNKVVIAKVATLLFWSVIKFSISKLQDWTAVGWVMANLLSVRIAAKRRVDFGEDRKSCKTKIYRD
jgi:hypothetical protein